ncbi:MAG TPA: nucleotide disphospho-sugar-binding domain-containing protein, partial [Thermoleophilaceae bacterium]
EVTLETWSRWREAVEREGMRFAAAPEYAVFPSQDMVLKPYVAAVRAASSTREVIQECDPEVVVADIITSAASLAAQAEGRRWATLIPHVMPTGAPGFPIYSIGAVHPRTAAGARFWSWARPLVMRGEEQGRRELNGARERIGLPPLPYTHGGISRDLAIVATFPQLEYPRAEPWPGMRVTGPLLWEQPFGDVELPPGDAPLVLVAPSTSQDPEQRLVRAALEGLADSPVRVLATLNRRPLPSPVTTPANARVVDWVSYARTMPLCDAVVCHAGHGTVARSLASGVPVVACGHAGDQAENAARIRWAGVGVSLPRRFQTPTGVRLAVHRLLADASYGRRAEELRDWAAENDGRAIAADAVETLAEASSDHKNSQRAG